MYNTNYNKHNVAFGLYIARIETEALQHSYHSMECYKSQRKENTQIEDNLSQNLASYKYSANYLSILLIN